MTETNAEISITAASFSGAVFLHPFSGEFLAAPSGQALLGCVLPAAGKQGSRKAHSFWSAPFLLKSCPVVAEKQWENFPERTTK